MNQQNYFSQIQEIDLTPQKAYEIYGTIKTHYTTKWDYDGKLLKNFSNSALSDRKDKLIFQQVSDEYQYIDRFLPVVAINMFNDTSTWVKDLLENDAKKNGQNFRAYIRNPKYSFNSDIRNLVLSKHILSVKDLYSQNTRNNYFAYQSRNLIHPATASILNNIFYTKYFANTSLAFIYKDKSIKYQKLLKFIPEGDVIDELFVIETIQDILDN